MKSEDCQLNDAPPVMGVEGIAEIVPKKKRGSERLGTLYYVPRKVPIQSL